MDGLNTDYDSLILQVLQGPGGLTTGLIAGACKPYLGHDKRVHSRYIRNRLLALQEAGKVRPMDDLKPVCWVPTSP
jgi:hypothetical protein